MDPFVLRLLLLHRDCKMCLLSLLQLIFYSNFNFSHLQEVKLSQWHIEICDMWVCVGVCLLIPITLLVQKGVETSCECEELQWACVCVCWCWIQGVCVCAVHKRVCMILLSILSEWIATVADMELLVCKYVCMFYLKVLSLDILKLLENCIFTLIWLFFCVNSIYHKICWFKKCLSFIITGWSQFKM